MSTPKKDRKRKDRATIYLPDDLAEELVRESIRQDRSISWLARCAWEIAKDKIALAPTMGDDDA